MFFVSKNADLERTDPVNLFAEGFVIGGFWGVCLYNVAKGNETVSRHIQTFIALAYSTAVSKNFLSSTNFLLGAVSGMSAILTVGRLAEKPNPEPRNPALRGPR